MINPHYSLKDAALRFFPGGNITARSLHTEIRHGRLHAIKVAGKLVVDEGAIIEMLNGKWRDNRKARASTSDERKAQGARAGQSKTANVVSAQAAALMTPKERESFSLDT